MKTPLHFYTSLLIHMATITMETAALFLLFISKTSEELLDRHIIGNMLLISASFLFSAVSTILLIRKRRLQNNNNDYVVYAGGFNAIAAISLLIVLCLQILHYGKWRWEILCVSVAAVLSVVCDVIIFYKPCKMDQETTTEIYRQKSFHRETLI